MIHAELSPEARARLEAMRRNSTISSIVIAFLVVTLVLLILGWLTLKPLFKETPVIVTYNASIPAEEVIETKKVSTQTQQKPSAPSSSNAKVIAANTSSNLAVPVPEVEALNPSTDFGNGDDFGDGWGTGGESGGGGDFGAIPATMRKRCSKEDRLQRLAETGGNEQCEEAVLKSLRWMKKTQAPDGSFPGKKKSAMTGLALLAYLGHCETPLSEEFGDTVLKAMTYLINLSLKNDGKCADVLSDKFWPYEHAICVYALAEATTFCKQMEIPVPNLEQATQNAGQFLIDNQHKSGGWDYLYDEAGNRGGDVSITGWHLQALKAMKHTGLDFKNLTRCSKNGLEYLSTKQDTNGGFGYTSKKPHGSTHYGLTGVGVLCFQMWDKETSPEVRKGAAYIEEHSKVEWGPKLDLYNHYYEAQAMMNRGGKEWKHYNGMMRDQVLKNQNADGTWTGGIGGQHGVVYTTALTTLMLEVYYRFLPGTGSH